MRRAGLQLLLKRLLILAGWLLLVWVAVQFTWSLLQWLYPLPEPAASSQPASSKPQVLWVSQLDRHWVAAEKTEPEIVAEPIQRSQLRVEVQGLFYSSIAGRSVVVLKYRNQDYTLSEGDELESGLSLQEVQRDALIFNRDGQLERVDLDLAARESQQERQALLNRGEASQQASSRRESRRLESSRDQPDDTAEQTEQPVLQERVGTRALEETFGPDFRDSLVRDPLQLMRHITLSPHNEGGQLQGFRIRPGSDPALFNSLGLEEGDLVVAVDGTPVSDTSAMMNLHGQLATARSLDVEIIRAGERLLFSLEME